MKILTPAERRALRARAHHVHPVVIVGHHGLTPAVLHEIDVALLAHELIKVRVGSDDRSEREALLTRICAELDAAPVQHIGRLLVVFRPAPEPEPVAETAAPRKARPAAKPAARKARPQQPAARVAETAGGRRRGSVESDGEAGRRARGSARIQDTQGRPRRRRAR
jgi:putative YhbY family RNA-binding protein